MRQNQPGLLSFKEFVNLDLGFPEYSAESAFGHVAVVMGKCDFSARHAVTPDLVAAGSGPIEVESEGVELASHFAILEASKATH